MKYILIIAALVVILALSLPSGGTSRPSLTGSLRIYCGSLDCPGVAEASRILQSQTGVSLEVVMEGEDFELHVLDPEIFENQCGRAPSGSSREGCSPYGWFMRRMVIVKNPRANLILHEIGHFLTGSGHAASGIMVSDASDPTIPDDYVRGMAGYPGVTAAN